MKQTLGLVLLSLLGLSCSNSSSNSGTTPASTVMQWTAGSRSIYALNLRDTANNNFDMDIASWYDTTVRTIISTNQTFMGKSNVMEYRDSDMQSAFPGIPGIVSYGFMSQDNDGTVWIYGYGGDVWDNYFTHKFIDVGWVKYYDGSASNWNNDIDIGTYVNSNADTHVLYSESLQNDDTVSMQGKSYTAKHILHTITTSTTGYTSFFTIYIDSYLVFELGMPMKEIVHSYTDWEQKKYYGTTNRMIAQMN